MNRVLRWSPDMGPLGDCVVAMGVFDGVHLGHQTLVDDAVAMASARGARCVVVTFDRDPDQVVSPLTAAPQLLDLEDKLSLLSRPGVDVVLVMPFDGSLAETAPLVFLDEVLIRSMTPLAVIVGYDFRFGHRALGDVDLLVRYGADHGFTVVAHQLVQESGSPITSTRIRSLVAAGDVAGAARLLGRPHRVVGEVVHGRGAGASLQAPTANLATGRFAALPAEGVYAGRVMIDGVTHAAAVSVGTAPTFERTDEVVEAHVIGYAGDLYGRTLSIEFIDRLRDLQRFERPEDLAEAVRRDIILAAAMCEASF